MKGRSKKSNQTGSSRRKRRIRPPKDDPAATPSWDVAQALAARVPDREWRRVPSDLASDVPGRGEFPRKAAARFVERAAHLPAIRGLAQIGIDQVPPMIAREGESAAWRFIEFFTANIRNLNTRRAYARAVGDFFRWCEQRRVRDIAQISPTLVAAYVEHRSRTHAKPTVKQELAAVRMLFDCQYLAWSDHWGAERAK